MLQAGDYHFDESVNQRFRYPQDFDQNRYRAYLRAAGVRIQARPEDLLASLDAAVPDAEGISLRQGGVLFFARDPQRFVKESHVSCVRFAGSERLHVLDRQEISGSPPELIERAIAFTTRNIRTAYVVDARPRRREVYEYPLVAIREAVTNAVMHRDYHYDAAHVFVSIFADRLEVENPSGLFSGLSLADLGKRSVRRNRLVADLLFRARYVERVGSGIPRIRQALEENGTPPPWRFRHPTSSWSPSGRGWTPSRLCRPVRADSIGSSPDARASPRKRRRHSWQSAGIRRCANSERYGMPGSWSAAVSAERPSTSVPDTSPGDGTDYDSAATNVNRIRTPVV